MKEISDYFNLHLSRISRICSLHHIEAKDQYEVDTVIENSFDEVIGIEVKAAASVNSKDLHGLNRLKEVACKKFKLGILLYDGDHTSSFGDKLFAVPIASLWT